MLGLNPRDDGDEDEDDVCFRKLPLTARVALRMVWSGEHDVSLRRTQTVAHLYDLVECAAVAKARGERAGYIKAMSVENRSLSAQLIPMINSQNVNPRINVSFTSLKRC